MAIGEPHQPDPRIGREIGGKFRIRECIGLGASGTVYRADQLALGRTVAIKILSEDLATDPRLVKRFHDEALAASRLNHPNTVSVIDYGQTPDGLLYLVMEYLAGATLTELIERDFPLPVPTIVDAAVQILSGLEEAHAAGVVHADLKADNIVVEERRDRRVYKVVDFGIARLVNAPQPEDDGDERTICGTPEYMAPEVIGGADPSFASDLYAVGILLYELLVGETPFVGGSAIDVLRRHLQRAPVAPSDRCPDLPASAAPIEHAILRALSKHPTDRFASAAEMRAAVQAALETRPDASGAQSLCQACGVASPASFKFCPECGAARKSHERRIEVRGGEDPEREWEQVRATAQTELGALELGDRARGILPLPLVGRDESFAELVRFLSGQHPASVLVLTGETGVGKSRLLREAAERTADAAIYATGPDPTGLATAFHPVRALLASILALPPVCPYDGLRRAITDRGLSSRELPGIAALFGHHGELAELEPEVRRREVVDATMRALATSAAGGPAVLVFEDVERYDHASQDFVSRLAHAEDPDGLRVVLTCRTELAEAWPPSAARLHLDRLDDEAALALARHLQGGQHAAMPDDATLLAHAAGLPAHVHHLARYVIEGGVIDRAPASLADLIAERLALLPHPALILVQTAATFGMAVERGVLRHAAGPALHDAFDHLIAVLGARGILSENDTVVGFEDALLCGVAHDGTPADVRRALHASAATTLARTTTDPAILGHHHDLAGDREQAMDLLARAGDEALAQLDEPGAAALYQRALRAARGLMLGGEVETARDRFVALSVRLADSLRVTGTVGLARGVVDEARPHSAGSPILEAQLDRASAHLSMSEGRLDEAAATMQRAIGGLIPTGEMDLLGATYLDLANILVRAGQHGRALSELDEAVSMITLGEGPTAEGAPSILWRVVLRLARLHAARADHQRALQLCDAALAHARRTGSAVGVARVQSMRAQIYERQGDREEAARCRRAAVDEMRRLGDRRGTAELLVGTAHPTRSLLRLAPEMARIARSMRSPS